MKTTNLALKLEKGLPAELVGALQTSGEAAGKLGVGLYLVGGAVRDLLRDKPSLDLDLVIEGDAIALARQLAAARKKAKLTVHPRFKTAKLELGDANLDFATARSESYARPGALPTVKPSSIAEDLCRRDFSLNAMAISLNAGSYGELIDPYSGQQDLARNLIRILHPKSFTDDATRIWRALRYRERLGFQLEQTTLELLKRDTSLLKTVSGDRIRYELECVLAEANPENILNQAGELGVLHELHPSLKADSWLKDRFAKARGTSAPGQPSPGLYLTLFTYRLNPAELETLIAYLKLNKPTTQLLRDSQTVKAKLKKLAYPEIKPSYVYRTLHGALPSAVTAAALATTSPISRHHLENYLHKLRYVKPALNGNDLLKLGYNPGPGVKETLEELRDARLDGSVTSKESEKALVMEWFFKKT